LADGTLVIVLAGDLILDVPEPDHWLSGITPAVQMADVAIGHLEVPHTRRGQELVGDVPAPGAPPENLAALARAGFTALTLAGNHMADCGAEGIADTTQTLREHGLQFTGAGANLSAAREPIVISCKDRLIGVLSYNCVGPEASWATADRAGCNYLRITTADGTPTAPAADLRDITSEAFTILRDDIQQLRRKVGLVIVALHKGIVHTPAKLAPYERALAHAAIDAGADVVLGHHAHIVRGLERYRDRPLFHGLGNGCVVTHALSPNQNHAARADWARKRRERFGFEPDPAYTLAPFHPEAVHAMLGRVLWHDDGSLEWGIIPVHVEPPGRPVIANEERAPIIASYIECITTAAGLPGISLKDRKSMWAVAA
jgi:Bacterial capsule synthesis protein PGA_cap